MAYLYPPGTIAWIVEPKDGKTGPYLTLKEHVAVRRHQSGDFVTPYISQRGETLPYVPSDPPIDALDPMDDEGEL